MGHKAVAELLYEEPGERIRRILRDTLASTPWAQGMFAETSTVQGDFYRHVLDPSTNRDTANASYQVLLSRLACRMNVRIRQGEENVAALRGEPGAIVVSNHLGIGRVAPVDNSDGSFDFPNSWIEAFPMGMMPGFVVARACGTRQLNVHLDREGAMGDIYRKLDGIYVSASGGGGVASLVSAIRAATEEVPSTFLIFPEGRTSGKSNCGGPYDLDVFHAGAFVVGCQAELPILPVCQYLDPNRGVDLLTLPSMRLGEGDLANVKSIAETTRQAMQQALSNVLAVAS